MRKTLIVALVLLTFAVLNLNAASAQLPGKIKIPKPKPKPQPTPTETTQPAPAAETQPAAQSQPNTSSTSAPAAAAPAAGQDLPAIAREWLLVRPVTISPYKGNYDVSGWLPRISFHPNIDRPSGANYYAEFMQPGGAPWVKLDCSWEGEEYECKAPDESDQKSITAVGVFPFAIKMKNALTGTDQTLFTGKVKVEKGLRNDAGVGKPNLVSYFANYDWALPIGYVFDEGDHPSVAFMVRGTNSSGLQLHAFYKGQEVGSADRGPFTCGDTEQNPAPTNYTASSMPQGGTWERVACSLWGLRWDEDTPGYQNLSKNPGEYEIKVLWKNEQVRTMKFTVGLDGKVVDNGIARANGIVGLDRRNGRNTSRRVIPVTILGTQDGKWDRTAWKTDAFFGNPLKGFTPPQ